MHHVSCIWTRRVSYNPTGCLCRTGTGTVGGTVVLLVRHKLCKFPFINKVRKTDIHNSLQCKLPRGSCVEYFDFVVSINSALLGVT